VNAHERDPQPERDAARERHADPESRERPGADAHSEEVDALKGPAGIRQNLFDERQDALAVSVELLVQAHAHYLVVLDERYGPSGARGFDSQTTHSGCLAGMLRPRGHNRSSL
jgi:hypothetical protein